MNVYSVLADLVVVVHLGYVAFVVLGLVSVLLGIVLRWNWIRNAWFRTVHLIMIAVVVMQSLAGIVCPLTTLEYQLRLQAGETVEQTSFVARLVHRLLFVAGPPWAFTVSYCVFGAAVLATWILAPPRFIRMHNTGREV